MPRFCANLSMMFTEVDFPDRFAAAARAGFKGVEYLFPYALPAEDIRALLDDAGVEQVLFNMPPGDWDAGERGIACHPDRVDDFKRGVERALDYAAVLGNTRVHAMAGIQPDGVSAEAARETYLANLAYAAPLCRDAGLALMIEAINTRDIPGFFLSTSDQAMAVLDDLGALGAADGGTVRFQFDVYHIQIMQGDLAPTFDACLSRTAHVQIADTPGRHEPGTGEIHYPFLFDHMDAAGYDGWVGCEYKPKAGTEAGLGWIKGYL